MSAVHGPEGPHLHNECPPPGQKLGDSPGANPYDAGGQDDPWLFGMGAYVSGDEALKFKAKMMGYMCQWITHTIQQQAAESKKIKKRFENVAEGKNPDDD